MSSATFLNVYDRSKKKTAVLDNAFNITETQELNQIYHLSFSIPSSDLKTQYLQPFHYVRYGETGQLYRIVKRVESEESVGTMTVDCEHVITTLLDTVMFGNVQYGGSSVNTQAVINYLLNRQNVKNWELGSCAFSQQLEYLWEQENLLNALYSVPKSFTESYYWDFDTSSMTGKWKLHLKRINSSINPEYYIRAKQNLLSQGCEQDNTGICTRIYPLGYGEGVNQLTIKSVNNNVAYLENSAAVAQYGVIEKVLVDRRFENAASLKAYAQTVLDGLSVPSYSRSFAVADLYPITNEEINNAKVGKICKLTGDGTIAYITKTVRVLDDPGNMQIELSTKATDVVSTIADLADRVRIESVYSQGATQLYQHSKDANAAPQKGKGMILSLYFPSEMKQINKVLLKLELKKFRSYSDTTSNGGGTTATSTDGGATSTTTQSGGGTSTSTQSGGGTSTSTQSGGGTSTSTQSGGGTGSTSTNGADVSGSGSSDAVWTYLDFDYAYTGAVAGATQNNIYTEDADGSEGSHNHQITEINIPSLAMDKNQLSHSHSISVDCGSHSHTFSVPSHSHSFSVPSHSHSFSVPSHSHSFSVPSHSHNFSIPNHKHNVTIPDHTHSIVPGIFESSENPTKFDIYVGSSSTPKATVNAKTYNGDITQWLLDSNTKLIPRDSWINIEIVPNTLAYVVSSVFVQGFVQSRGGGNY